MFLLLPALVLRDVQLPAAPGWWPLPPGWWLVIAVIAVVAVVLLAALALGVRRQRARAHWAAAFDRHLAQAASPGGRVLAAAELLRRGALQHAPHAAALQGASWLAWVLDSAGAVDGQAAQVLLDGGYRPQLSDELAAQACALARKRFITLMTVQR